MITTYYLEAATEQEARDEATERLTADGFTSVVISSAVLEDDGKWKLEITGDGIVEEDITPTNGNLLNNPILVSDDGSKKARLKIDNSLVLVTEEVV